MNITISGLQWGDEGKGKIIDLISNYYDLIIRNNGGHNAGHIIIVNNKKKKIKILPSGIFKKNNLCLLSNEVVLSLKNFFNEIKCFKKLLNKIIISKNCLLVNNIDELIDFYLDKILKIGTTNSGISIIFIKKYIKCLLKIKDFYRIFIFNKIKKQIFFYNLFFKYLNLNIKILLIKFYFNNFIYINNIKKNIVNNNIFVNNNYNKLFENAQGSQLDINKGTYPFVTCSNTLNKSVFINSNFFFCNIKHIGIIKSYVTRVGNGFLNTIFKKKKNILFSILNNEIGTNSLRIRNSGWIDLFSIFNTIKLNNICNLILTRMDSLFFLKKIKILINYKIKNFFFDDFNNINFYNSNYLNFNSWFYVKKKYNFNCKNFHYYIRFIEKYLSTPIILISIGNLQKNIIIL